MRMIHWTWLLLAFIAGGMAGVFALALVRYSGGD